MCSILLFIDEIEDDDNDLEEDDPPSAELRFVPDDKSTCVYTVKLFCFTTTFKTLN